MRLRHDRHFQHGSQQVHGDENTGRVRPQLDASADFAQSAGLLQHDHIYPGAAQCVRRRETANTGTHDQNSQFSHRLTLLI